MKKRNLLSLAAFLVAAMVQAADSPRTVLNLNFGWRFHSGDVARAETADLDDAQWPVVNVPHDFQIEQPWAPSGFAPNALHLREAPLMEKVS